MESDISTTNNTSNRLLRAVDVARRLSISRSLVYQLLLRGDIPTVRIGRSVRVRESDLEGYILRSWSGWKQE